MPRLASARLLLLLACLCPSTAALAAPIITRPLVIVEPSIPERAPALLRAARAISDLGTDHGDTCIVRIWRRLENGSAGELLMYRHGAGGSLLSNIGGALHMAEARPQEVFEELLSKDIGRDRLPDYVTTLSLVPSAKPKSKPVLLSLELVDGGRCNRSKDDNCARGIGFLVNKHEPTTWVLAEPVPITVEDSCAKAKNGNFIDAKPFYKKLRIPD